MPNKVSEEVEEQILNFVKEYPPYGPERMEAEFKKAGIKSKRGKRGEWGLDY